MSRIIVKNLSKNVTEENIRKHFEDIGTITDINLKYKDGVFRRFAFIGFKSSNEAEIACNKLNDSYMNQSKIHVELCKDLKIEFDNDKKEVIQETLKDAKDDRKQKIRTYKNLLKHQIKTLTKERINVLLKDDDFVSYLKANQKGSSDLVKAFKEKYDDLSSDEDSSSSHDVDKKKSDLEYLKKITSKVTLKEEPKKKEKKWKELFTVVIRTKEQNTDKEKKGRTLTKKCIKTFLKPVKYKSLRIPQHLSYVAYVGFRTEKEMKQILLKDKSFLDGVRVRIHKYENKKKSNDKSHLENAPWTVAEEKLKSTAQPVSETGKLFVRNLWYSTTEEDLRKIFEKYGPLAELTLPICKETRKLKGFAHISFVFPEHAEKALKELDGSGFQGRVLHILPSNIKEDEDIENLTFKEKKKKKRSDPLAWHNWNSLFLGTGAVVDLMSEKLKKSKQEILRNEGDRNQSVATTIALAETQLVEQTKKFLEEEGICLDSFSNSAMQRSSTVLLVKHLPAHTTAQELSQLFNSYGEVGRVILPPSGLTGIVEFLDPTEAKLAYKDLAYTRFKHLPLYLEWAPLNTFASKQTIPKTVQEGKTQSLGIPENNTTLYVKNLNFKTDEEALEKYFSDVGPVYSVLIAKKRCLSQGYGFVQYYKNKDAKKALVNLQNSPLDGHTLNIKQSEKSLVPDDKRQELSNNSSSKLVPVIMVKNIPFESSLSEIKELFRTFGELSAVRLPRHIGKDQHRGFCFVEFMSLESAQNAFSALSSSTHLGGRRLVLEWAKTDESVDELRKRTADHFLAPKSLKTKKIKISEEEKEKG